MSQPQTRIVKHAAAPVTQPEIQLELTKRSAWGLATAVVALGVLIFLAGLVIGVSLTLQPTDVAELPSVGMEQSELPEEVVRTAAAVEVAPGDTLAAALDPALRVGTFEPAPGPAANEPRPELGARLTAPGPSSPLAAPASEPVQRVSETGGAGAGSRATASNPLATFLLQVGAFRTPENADILKARLSERGYPARVRVTEGSAGRPLYRVLLGEYPTELSARNAAERFEGETGQEAYVMTSTELGS